MTLSTQYQIVNETVEYEGEGGGFPVGTQVWTVLTASSALEQAVTNAPWLYAYRALTIEDAALWIIQQERATKINEQHPVTFGRMLDSQSEAQAAHQQDEAIIQAVRGILVGPRNA